jgi:GDPmannose 4,6-dehydratase
MEERVKRAFITGITGQDGFYLAELLIKKGYVVHGFARRMAEGLPEGVVVHVGDLTDMKSLEKAMREANPSEVYNLAAQSSVVASHAEPVYTADVDGLATTRVLEIVRSLGTHVRLFQASSMQMYGRTSPPFTDASLFLPFTPYGIAKLYSHLMCQSYRRFHNVYVSCGILFHHESPRRAPNFFCRKVTMGVAAILAGKVKS